MATHQQPEPHAIVDAINACLLNGERLLEETYDLEFRNPPATRLYLIMTAQEEFAKGFILYLVREQVIPFTPLILRAMNDHTCKQLVGMIMDYVIMHWEDMQELEAAIRSDLEMGDDRFPEDVLSAMELLRYEKIGKWKSKNWEWVEDPNYDKSALQIAEGKKDRRKQDTLYVRIGGDGRVASTPFTVTNDSEVRDEFERAGRYNSLVASLLDDNERPQRYDKVMAALKLLFANLD